MNELVAYDHSVDFAISAWLDEKRGLSHSRNTERVYQTTMQSFRNACLSVGVDLDAPAQQIALLAQAWAGRAGTKEPAPSTFNQRRGVISSFYEYCLRHELLGLRVNPIRRVKPHKVYTYGNVTPLGSEILRQGLSEIDTGGLAGKRDYAILVVALTTGRRLNEIASIRWEDLQFDGNSVAVVFPNAKGGKVMRDRLTPAVSAALHDYLSGLAAHGLVGSQHGAVFLSLARNDSHGKPLTVRSIESICERRLGTSRVHSLRHSFAHMMEDAGATTSEIQHRLGHANIATTGIYLAALRSDENKHADDLACILGL